MATEIRKLNYKDGSFTGMSGKKYIIQDTVALGRYEWLEKFGLEITFGGDAATLLKGMGDAWQKLDKGNLGQAAIILYNHMEGTARIEQGNRAPIYYVCSLFCTGEGENISEWDYPSADEKIKDWADIDYQFFFHLAIAGIPGLSAALKEHFQNILGMVSEKQGTPSA